MLPMFITRHYRSHAASRRSPAATWIAVAVLALTSGCGSSLGSDAADLTGDWEFHWTIWAGVTFLQDSSGALTGTGWEVIQCGHEGQFCQFSRPYALTGRYHHPSVSFELYDGVTGADTSYRFVGHLVECGLITGYLNGAGVNGAGVELRRSTSC